MIFSEKINQLAADAEAALSPYFAKHFAEFLEGETQLDKEADLTRHIRKFYRQDF